jgi:hypothetical protein
MYSFKVYIYIICLYLPTSREIQKHLSVNSLPFHACTIPDQLHAHAYARSSLLSQETADCFFGHLAA